jgi:hypothetical protein
MRTAPRCGPDKKPMAETHAFVEISARSAAELAAKYMALWNEPDADRRRLLVAELWTEDARHILQPPQEIRGIAAGPGSGKDKSIGLVAARRHSFRAVARREGCRT